MLEDLDEQLGDISEDKENTAEPDSKAEQQDANQHSDDLKSSNNVQIEKIKQAISGIDSGTYGICMICGQPIKKEQLKQQPFSSLCLNCARKNDASKG